MERREHLKQLLTLATGIAWLPAISFSCQGTVETAGLDLTEDAKNTIQELCEHIIPSDAQVKGSKDLLLSDFVLLMVNDCLTEDERKKYVSGYQALEKISQEGYQKGITALDRSSLQSLLTEVTTDTGDEGEKGRLKEGAKYFVNTTKNYLILGFTVSKYYMTEIMPYNMFPGGFKGAVKFNPGEKINIHG